MHKDKSQTECKRNHFGVKYGEKKECYQNDEGKKEHEGSLEVNLDWDSLRAKLKKISTWKTLGHADIMDSGFKNSRPYTNGWLCK